MNSTFLWLAAVLTLATALLHSFFGERRLIRPLLSLDAGVLQTSRTRKLVRFSWHATSLLWLVVAYVLASAARNPSNADPFLIGLIGIIHLAVGLFDAVMTKGTHVGWPPLTLIGVFSLLALI
jgi:hypothetical protein